MMIGGCDFGFSESPLSAFHQVILSGFTSNVESPSIILESFAIFRRGDSDLLDANSTVLIAAVSLLLTITRIRSGKVWLIWSDQPKPHPTVSEVIHKLFEFYHSFREAHHFPFQVYVFYLSLKNHFSNLLQ
jgi:hypothetical protein